MQERQVFFDAEFTDLTGEAALMSIAFVAGDDTLYLELTDGWALIDCSDFVHERVLPLLGRHNPELLTSAAAKARIQEWLDVLRGGDKARQIVLVCDSPWDWELLKELFVGPGAPWARRENIVCRLAQGLLPLAQQEAFFEATDAEWPEKHHALADARQLQALLLSPLLEKGGDAAPAAELPTACNPAALSDDAALVGRNELLSQDEDWETPIVPTTNAHAGAPAADKKPATWYRQKLLETNLFDDLVAELRAAIDEGRGQVPATSVSLGFQFWVRHQPQLLANLDALLERAWDAARSKVRSHTFWRDDDAPCPYTAADLRATPAIAVGTSGIDVLISRYPLVFRAAGQGKRYGNNPFAFRGIELAGPGWLPPLDAFFGWLEEETVALKQAGFRDADLPLVIQVKQKFGRLTVYASPGPLGDDYRRRLHDLELAAAGRCEYCGAPGTLRSSGWIHVACDVCETDLIQRRSAS